MMNRLIFAALLGAPMAAHSAIVDVTDFCIGSPEISVTLTGNATINSDCHIILEANSDVTFDFAAPYQWGIHFLAVDIDGDRQTVDDAYGFSAGAIGNGISGQDSGFAFPFPPASSVNFFAIDFPGLNAPRMEIIRFAIDIPDVPLPAPAFLLGASLMGLAAARRRRPPKTA